MSTSILCAIVAAVLLTLSIWRGVLLYRRSFITNIGSRLTRNFVLTNPRSDGCLRHGIRSLVVERPVWRRPHRRTPVS